MLFTFLYLGNIELLSETNLKNRLVREDHFVDSDFTDGRKIRLKKTAIPIKFKEILQMKKCTC